MAAIGIVSFKGFDYPIPDNASFTNRELRDCRVTTGLAPAEGWEALKGGDPSFAVWLLLTCARRTGATLNEDEVWDAPGGSIQIRELDEAEGDAGPPVVAANGAAPIPEPSVTTPVLSGQ